MKGGALETSKKLASTTLNQSRIKLFQATRTPEYQKGVKQETPWGSVTVTGKLGQGHADVLEALLYTALENGKTEDGRIKILVDPYQVKKVANLKSSTALNTILYELISAVLVIEIKQPNIKSSGHLIDYITDAVKSNGQKITKPNPMTGGERPMLRVELGKALTDIINQDYSLNRDPNPIARLKSGICQALARFVISHKEQPNGGWRLDTIIKHLVDENSCNQLIRDSRRRIRKNKDSLFDLGITVKDDRIFKNA